MIRKLLYTLLPFLVPFVLYGFYVVATWRARKRDALFNDAPWYWLFVSGLLLCIFGLLYLWYSGQGV